VWEWPQLFSFTIEHFKVAGELFGQNLQRVRTILTAQE
jgi:hypothetical protein